MTALGFVVLTLVWSAGLWLCAKLLTMAGPSPKLGQAIWRGAAALMLLPFAAAIIFSLIPNARSLPLPDMPLIEATIGDVVRSGAVTDTAGPAQPGRSFETLIGYLLVAGWALRFAVMGLRQFRLQRMKKSAGGSSLSAARWARALGLRQVPEVRTIARGSPFVAGVGHRQIFVPEALVTGPEVDQVIAHECVHLARGDLIARPFERIIADIFWISPFAWMMRTELDYWREAVVDEVTADLTGDRIAYARALTHAARVARPVQAMPVAAFILPRKGTLKMRLNALLQSGPRRSSRIGLAAAAIAVIAIPIGLAQGAGFQPSPGTQFTHSVMDKAKLTSGYGKVKVPGKDKYTWHDGVDLAEEYGKPVRAPCDGKVSSVGEKNGYGKYVSMYADKEYKLRFAMLSKVLVEEGQYVEAGDIIGKVGKVKGDPSGPHLHFEVWQPEKSEMTGKMKMKSVNPMHIDGLVLADKLWVPRGETVTSDETS